MDTILDMKNVFLSSVCFFYFQHMLHVTTPSKKTDQNEVNAIWDLLQCSRSSAYRQQKRASKNVAI